MEKNITKSNLFMPLFIHSLKEKKNWFLLSAIIILVTTLLIPNILDNLDTDSYFIVLGIAETFIIIFINCLIDNSFLHNDSKLAYYKSKPATMKTQISVNILINFIFAGCLVSLLASSLAFQNSEITDEVYEVFKVIIPWLAVGILLSALSSLLTGNTIMAAAMTIFNFALPMIIYLIIMFVFHIIENAVIGFGSDVLMEYFIKAVYKREYIYFYKYLYKPIDYIYVLLFATFLITIALITINCIKKRKNENTGNFIVYDGYKYFVSLLASLIVPAIFSLISSENNSLSEIIVSAILAIMSYYVIISIMEKSFKISKLAIKIFAVYMVLFVAVAGGTVAVANQYKNFVPEAKDVKIAYVGSSKYLFSDEKFRDIINSNAGDIYSNKEFLNWQNRNSSVMFTGKENIENIIDLHQELLVNQNYKTKYHSNSNLIFTYFMNDGSIIIRDYSINSNTTSDLDNQKKDDITYKIVNSHEMKEHKFYYLYDINHSNNNNIYCSVKKYGSQKTIVDNIKIDDIRDCLTKDIDKLYSELDNAFEPIISYDYDLNFLTDEIQYNYYIEIIEKVNKDEDIINYSLERIPLNENFSHTFDYLKLK